MGPIVERLLAVLGEVGPALLHFDQDDRLPDVVGEAGLGLVVEELLDALFERAPDFAGALLAEGAEEVVDKGLGFALLVALDVDGGPVDEVF